MVGHVWCDAGIVRTIHTGQRPCSPTECLLRPTDTVGIFPMTATAIWAKGKTMARMIEADKAMRIVREECLEFQSNSEIFTQTDLMLLSLNKAINTRIKALPYTDAEPVVRCKDCKFYNPHIRECEGFGKWFGLEDEWGDNDFCSRGERKDEVEE